MLSKTRVFVSALSLSLSLAALGFARSAAADEEIPSRAKTPSPALAGTSDAAETAPRGPGYGYQIVLADLTLISAGAGLSIATHSPWPGAGAGVGFFALSPSIHAAHGRGDLAGKSLLVRALAPLIGGAGGAAVGALLLSPAGSYGLFYGGAIGGGLGGGIGIIAATCIDAGSDPRERAPDQASRPAVRAQPTFAVNREGASVGVLGSF